MTVRKHAATSAAMVALLILTACGGGGGGGGTGPRTSSDDVRQQTGLAAPAETPAAQRARSPGIIARTDSLIISTMYVETDDSRVPMLSLRSSCSGTRCTVTEPTSGYSDTLTISDLEDVNAPVEAVGSKHGITLLAQSLLGEFWSFGAWMSHSGFAVQGEEGSVEGIRFVARYGLAGGDLIGAAPTGSATWRGLMVGTPAIGANRGDWLLGDAVLTYRLTGRSLDASFTGIRNVDRNAAHSTATVSFTGVPVSSGGTYRAGITGNRIQGGFYGPGQAEAAGVFEQSNIVGAFGAKRQ